jgi:hypothetical protein
MPLYCYQHIWIEDYNYVPLFQDIVIERDTSREKEIMTMTNTKVLSYS